MLSKKISALCENLLSLGHQRKEIILLVFLNNLFFSWKKCAKSLKESHITSARLS